MKNKFKLSLLAVSCAAFLTACSSSSGGADNTEQLRQTENTFTKKLVEISEQLTSAQSQVQNAQTKYNEASKRYNNAELESAKLSVEVANLRKAQAELALAQAEQKGSSEEELKKLREKLNSANQAVNNANKTIDDLKTKEAKAAEEHKATEERLKQLENSSADEKARIPVNDQIFGGRTGVMTDRIAGAVFADVKSKNVKIGLPLSNDITKLHIVDEGKFIEVEYLVKKADEVDDWGYEIYDPYNLRKDGQTIQSNSNLKSTAFGVYVDNFTGKQYLYAQGNPTDVKEIPKAGKAEYLGGAVYSKDGAYNERAKMTATVDFGKNTVAIKIDQNQDAVPEMNFGGKITGNSFAGEVNGVKTQGGFFGENAKELSGVFTNDADKSRGVFGAIKQDAAQ